MVAEIYPNHLACARLFQYAEIPSFDDYTSQRLASTLFKVGAVALIIILVLAAISTIKLTGALILISCGLLGVSVILFRGDRVYSTFMQFLAKFPSCLCIQQMV